MTEYGVRLLAFYLPQFHPIPENDEWWGKGFTEWTNVARARPLFPGHYQPHIPADLGFYDLRLPEVRQAQADLAREYGIYGFVYYHYWLGGKRLLELPFDEVLASGKPDFPFCLCWANEPWTRGWDGRNSQVLMAQDYSEEDDLKHIRWLVTAFRDRRYIRICDKPLILIYRASQLPDALRTTTIWREEARRMGIGELFLGRVESFPDEFTDPAQIGFDAAVEFQPDGANLVPRLPDAIYSDHEVIDYPAFMERQLRKPDPPYKRFPGVTPGWDNSPRRPTGARIFAGSTPALYEKWLCAAIRKASNNSAEERLVFINAWNEWGESNHLEPDLVFGRKYLEATKRTLDYSQNELNIEPAQVWTDEGRAHITKLEEQITALERREMQLREEFQKLERWAHGLEQTAREQERVIRRYQRWIGPVAPLLHGLRRLRNRLIRNNIPQ
jgi:lipopolysaccharide biosynthesis protein